jgi:hypothetical protein
MPTVALAAEFFDAFAALPRAQQKKVREFTAKFQANPTSAAIHYEKIHDVIEAIAFTRARRLIAPRSTPHAGDLGSPSQPPA